MADLQSDAALVPVYDGYFEPQEAARCGLHALNNALGCPFADAGDMAAACDELLRSMKQDRECGCILELLDVQSHRLVEFMQGTNND
jgi:hypothetical protein